MDRFKRISSIDVPEGHPITEFDRFWNEQKLAHTMVPWSSFEPMSMPKVLPWILLLSHLPNNEYQYRLCGTGCEQLLGVNLTGHVFGSAVNKQWAHKSKKEFEAVRAGEGPFFSMGKLPIVDREFIEVQRAVYGLTTNSKTIDRIMVVVAPKRKGRLTIAA